MNRERNAVASKSAGACTGRTGCRNINGERRTIPQLVSTLSRQNQCDLNLLHPLQHPLDRSTSPRACLPASACLCLPLPGLCIPLSFELPLHVEFHYRKQSAAAPLSMECVLSSPTMDTSCYFFFLFFFFSFYFGDFFCFSSFFCLFVLSLSVSFFSFDEKEGREEEGEDAFSFERDDGSRTLARGVIFVCSTWRGDGEWNWRKMQFQIIVLKASTIFITRRGL